MTLSGLVLSVLLVGHSLFGQDTPQMLQQLLSAAGARANVEAQIINGAPLAYNWQHGRDAQGVNARDLLAEREVDVAILTEALPLDDHLKWSGTDEHALKYHAAATARAPETRVFLQQTWPSGVGSPGWAAQIAADRAKWQGVVDSVNAMRAPGTVPMRLMPAGDAMLALDAAIGAGQVPGLSSISALFEDDVHLGDLGHYYVALLQYAVISGESPVGLPHALKTQWGKPYAVPDAGVARRLQQIAWQVGGPVSQGLTATVPEPRVVAVQPKAPMAAVASNPDRAPPAVALGADLPDGHGTIGVGLAPVNDWSTQQPFLDVMKTARPWIVHKAGQWGGGSEDDLIALEILDDNGWPTRLPRELGSIGTVILTDLPAEADAVAGRYRLSFEGTGVVEVLGRATNKDYGKNEVTFDFAPGDGPVEIRLRRSDPGRTGDYVRNITVVKEEYRARHDRGEIFNPLWLARIGRFGTLRFMDWMETNDSPVRSWQDRSHPDDYTYASDKGVPLEIMLALIRQTGADAWFNMPHLADDAYVSNFSRAVRDGLGPGTRVYVEFSNEVWNWMFGQANWAADGAEALWGDRDAMVQYYARRASQVAQLWSDTFTEAKGDAPELVNVISTQTGWLGLEEAILNAPLWQQSDPTARAPASYFDAYAVTAYFSGALGTEDRATMVRQWLDDSREAARKSASALGLSGDDAARHVAEHAYDRANERAGQELMDGSLSGSPHDTLDGLLGQILPYHVRVAAAHDLDLVVYEGGTHVVGIGAVVDDAELADFFTHFNYTSEMGALYERLLSGWKQLGAGVFVAYADVTAPTKWGSWGHLRHLGDENPRWSALISAVSCETACDRP